MKSRALTLLPILALVVSAFLAGSARKAPAQDPVVIANWEYLHLLIPLDRNPATYRRNDARILEPLLRAGDEGWELVSANEPANSLMVDGKASVEFFLKRPKR